MRRSIMLSAAISTALGVSALAATTPAQGATTPQPPGIAASGDFQHPGILNVRTFSDIPVTGITAHFFPLRSPEGTPEAGSTDDFSVIWNPGGKTTDWQTAVHLPEHGEYRMTFDVTDASGATFTGLTRPYTVLHYQTAMRIPDFSVTPTAPDYSHQRVTVSGTLLAEPPGEPEASVPVAGEEVDIETGHAVIVATTGPDGRFTADFVPTARDADVYARHGFNADAGDAVNLASSSVRVTTVQWPTRVSVNTHTLNLAQGATGTVTGLAEIQTPEGWQPLPGSLLAYTNGPSGTGLSGAYTDGHGRYTLKVPSTGAALAGRVVLAGDDELFATMSSQPLTVHVAFKTVLNANLTLDDRSRLHVTGSLNLKDSRAHWPAKPAVVLDYSKNGKTGWKAVATLPVTVRHNKAGVAETFGQTRTAPSDGYWRVRFQGNPDLAPAVTKTVHLRRLATRVVGFNATPEPVRKGDHIWLNGTVQVRSGTGWKPLRDWGVSLYFKPRGAKSYRYLYQMGLDDKGRFANWERATQDGTWAAVLDGTTAQTYLVSNTVSDYVDVR
ncbi:hypothetical protein ACFYXS_34445 [Streptomyces sp. NPDC002574]|uniref:hypothetical protein n=1 Tax=Streptomyces sp. NPDC002574 TaxID=3364652 RepID=UPI0036A7B1A9